jgi:hypothetical protein
MTNFNDKRFKKLAGLLKEQENHQDEWTRSQTSGPPANEDAVGLFRRLEEANPYEVSDHSEVRLPLDDAAEFLGMSVEELLAAADKIDEYHDLRYTMTIDVKENYISFSSGANV